MEETLAADTEEWRGPYIPTDKSVCRCKIKSNGESLLAIYHLEITNFKKKRVKSGS